MSRPITLFTGQWADLSLEELAQKVSSWGFDGLELACWGDHFEVDKALDDEEYVRDIAAQILGALGYKVTTSVDGAEAIGLYEEAAKSESPFDVVIIDLTIPGGTGGKETLQKLMKIDPEVKAIVSSGYSSDPIMTRFQQYGFKDVLAKPYKARELSVVLHRVMNDG